MPKVFGHICSVYFKVCNKALTDSSKADMAIPEAAPVPAKPMKCPDPMLLANKEAPTYKMHVIVLCFFYILAEKRPLRGLFSLAPAPKVFKAFCGFILYFSAKFKD